jgi:hypothetical protein
MSHRAATRRCNQLITPRRDYDWQFGHNFGVCLADHCQAKCTERQFNLSTIHKVGAKHNQMLMRCPILIIRFCICGECVSNLERLDRERGTDPSQGGCKYGNT